MTRLSVNLNKIALLRNSRGRDYPNVIGYAKKFIALGVHGITVHPRQDERHIKRRDAFDLGELCGKYPRVEFNIEGYPSKDFIDMVVEIKPDQCTLVPDDADQLTSDHGWDIPGAAEVLGPVLKRLSAAGIRSSLFIDPDAAMVESAGETGADRVELYTEAFAKAFSGADENAVFELYRQSAAMADDLNVGINAGHDLDLNNLARFLEIPNILEVSIGHALTVECIDRGMEQVVSSYLSICA